MNRRLDYQDIDTITPAPNNPKEHQIDNVRESIDRFGYVAPMIVDERTGRLVVGHGRLESLKARRDAGETPPEGIEIDSTGHWLAPVVRGWSSRSDTDAAAYLILDNRQTELGGWNHQALADLLEEIGDPDLIELTGWDPADLEELLDEGRTELPPALSDPDDVSESKPDPITYPGDMWRLGPHRVLCGDATDISAVEKMLDGTRADCMWTDPPYGVSYVGKTKDAMTIENDTEFDLVALLGGAFSVVTAVLKPGAPVYVACPPGALQCTFINAFDQAGWAFRQSLVWMKNEFVLGHNDYHYRHELIMYGFTAGGKGHLGRGGVNWHGDNARGSVFEVDRPTRNREHPTMKPVALVSSMLENSCPRGGIVYDAFGGSGSTLIASHLLGLRAMLVELEPRYVDVICSRFQKFTGVIPELLKPDGTYEPRDFTDEVG